MWKCTSGRSSLLDFNELETSCQTGTDFVWECVSCKQVNSYHWKTYSSSPMMKDEGPSVPNIAQAGPQESRYTLHNIDIPSIFFCIPYLWTTSRLFGKECYNVPVTFSAVFSMPIAILGDVLSPFLAAVLFPIVFVFGLLNHSTLRSWGISLAIPRGLFCIMYAIAFTAIGLPMIIMAPFAYIIAALVEVLNCVFCCCDDDD
jgi:hypothetical protein